MKTETAIQLAGNTKQLAELLGITSGAISQWGEDIPEPRMWQLRVLRPAWFEEPQQPAQMPWDGIERRASDRGRA